MQKPTYRRKLYFVHPRFQGWFIAKVSALLVGTSVVSSVGVYLLAEDFVATTRRAAHVGALHWWGKFGPILVGTNLAALVVGAVVAGYVVLYASHKVVGPLVRVRRALAEIAEGRLHRTIPLREGDEIQDTVSAILAMENQLYRRVQAVEDALGELEANPEKRSVSRLREAVAGLPRYPLESKREEPRGE